MEQVLVAEKWQPITCSMSCRTIPGKTGYITVSWPNAHAARFVSISILFQWLGGFLDVGAMDSGSRLSI